MTNVVVTEKRLCARNALRTLLGEERGATIIEFAMVSAPFFALLIAVLMTSVVFFMQQGLETTAEAAARLITTGAAQSNAWTSAQFKSQVCQAMPPMLSCDNLMIDVQTASTFSAVSTTPPTITYDPNTGFVTNNWSYSTGAAGSIVIVRLMYIIPVVGAPLGFDLSNTSPNHRLLVATEVAKTEPYPS